MTDAIRDLTVRELGGAIGAGELSPIDVVDAYLQAIDRENEPLNAYVTVVADQARARAKKLASERPRGPLHGVPFAVKDLTDTAGVRTTYGSDLFRDHVPEADAEPVRRLQEAGAILLGKTNTHEFACGATTDNPHYGPTRNPWDRSRVPGGSSGGSAAAVAARLAPFATGSDTGGSIRIPAACCGVVGIKPTHGRVSLRGTFPMAGSFDHVGPLCRTADDCGIALTAMAGYDADDPWSRRFAAQPFSWGEVGAGGEVRRVGIPTDLMTYPTSPGVGAGLDAARVALADLGIEVRELQLGVDPMLPMRTWSLALAETWHSHRQLLPGNEARYGSDVLDLLEAGRNASVADILEALDQRERFARAFERALDHEVDAFLMPTCLSEATPIGVEEAVVNGVSLPASLALAAYTVFHDMTRLPTVAIPSGVGEGGLPTSVQITTALGAEAQALALASRLESRLWPESSRRPGGGDSTP